MALNERDFFTEKTELKPMTLTCPKCGHRAEYQFKWIRRTKKDRVPQGADERDRERGDRGRDGLEEKLRLFEHGGDIHLFVKGKARALSINTTL